jgi:hypothetical protein
VTDDRIEADDPNVAAPDARPRRGPHALTSSSTSRHSLDLLECGHECSIAPRHVCCLPRRYGQGTSR